MASEAETPNEGKKRKILDTRLREYDDLIRFIPELTYVHFVHASATFASPEVERFPPSPKETQEVPY